MAYVAKPMVTISFNSKSLQVQALKPRQAALARAGKKPVKRHETRFTRWNEAGSALDAARPKATGTRKQCGSFKLQEVPGLVNSCGCWVCHDRLAKSCLHNTRDTPG